MAKKAQSRGERRPVRRRRGSYNYADDAGSSQGVPPGDLTVRAEKRSSIELVRADWDSYDSLIFRPLPCLTDDTEQAKAKWMAYRKSPEKNQFEDWIRMYPAVKGFGFGKERFTFLLYDRNEAAADPNFDRSSLPYILVYDWASEASKKKRFPNMDWLDLLPRQGFRDHILTKPTSLSFVQGLIYKRGSQIYVRQGRPPKGANPDDLPQIIQLSFGAGRDLERMLNKQNAEWEGDERIYPRSMMYGDPVNLKYGKFIRLTNPKAKGAAADASEIGDSWEIGGDSYEQAAAPAQQHRIGYVVHIDDKLVSDNKATGMGPELISRKNPDPKQLALAQHLKTKVAYWDEVLWVPTVQEQALLVAKTLKPARALLERAWADHPEYLNDEDVRKVLTNATQVLVWSQEADVFEAPATSAAVADDASPAAPADAGEYAADEYVDGEEYSAEEYAEDDDEDAAEPLAAVDDDDDQYGEEFADGVAAEETPAAEETQEVDADGYGDVEEQYADGYLEESQEEPVAEEAADADAVEPEYTVDAYEDDEDYYVEADDPVADDPVVEEPVAEADDNQDLSFLDEDSPVTQEELDEMERALNAAEERSTQRAPKGKKTVPKKKTGKKPSGKAPAKGKAAKKKSPKKKAAAT